MSQDQKAFLAFIIVSLLLLFAQNGVCSPERWTKTTLLYEENFESESLDNWICELQNPESSSVGTQDGKLNIDVGGGATIWFKPELKGDLLIEYDVTIINEGGDNDRVSDLNQFWMASDPANTNLFTRGGKFTEYDNLRLYYVGMGGNHNSTTRFRRYPGGGERPLLAEYTTQAYLLKPHTNYHIEIICFKERTQYRVNGEDFFNYEDPDPLVEGHFGFRTVRNHETVENFKVYRLVASQLATLNNKRHTAERTVLPGENIQDAIDDVHANGGGVVTLTAGVHNITSPVQIKSNVTLQGEGNLASTLETMSDIKMIIQAGYGLNNVAIQNLVLRGSPTKNAGGIHLISYRTDHDRINLSGVHVFETGWGVHIKGAKHVNIENCNFSRNGTPEKKKYAHNLYLRRCDTVTVRNSIFNNSISGNGINISYSRDINIDNCEAIGNHFRGMRAADTDGFRVHNCVIAENGNVGLLANTEKVVTKNIDWKNNCVSNNGDKGIYARSGATGSCRNNNSYGNSDDYDLPHTVSRSGNVSDSSIVGNRCVSATDKAAPLRFFVSLQGNDMWSGRLERPSSQRTDGPFRSLEAARDTVRTLSLEERCKQPIEICILPGTYILKQPLILEAQDSGTEKAPIVYRSWKNKPAVISGGKEVRNWTKTELNGHPVLVADLSKLSERYRAFEQLWVNGHRAVQARTPDRGYLKIPTAPESREQFAYNEADAHYFDGIGVQDGVAVVFNKWLEYHMPLDRIDRENHTMICTKKSGRAVEADDDYYLEGGRAMLDQPGEWYLDRKAGKLYYYALKGESEVVAVIPGLVNVVRIEGDAANGQWVEYVQFRGLIFSHTTWVLPRTSGPSGYGQADIQMEGALRLQDTKHCLLEECEITAVGNYGLEIGPGCSENRILRCDIHDLGGGGLLIGPKIRPRSHKEGYKPGEEIPPVLKHPSDATRRNEIADCHIYDGGRYFHCAVGIWIGQSPDNHVYHNEIFDFYYSSISCGWTWGYGSALAVGNRFEYNHIHHIGQRRDGDGRVLSDMGGIYTLGDQTGTVIRNNVFHDIYAGKYGGWAIYFDEGTRNILAENNLVYRCRHSCFNQHYGKDNIVRNNILAFGDTSVVCLARAESHTSFILTNNILLSHGPPMYAGGYAHKVNKPGIFRANRNLVWSINGTVLGAQDRFPSRIYEPNEPVLTWQAWQALGYDQHALIADPGFKDPANGDFRLSEDSPASQIGFKPFALDKAGPR